jgi:hypothetical protein
MGLHNSLAMGSTLIEADYRPVWGMQICMGSDFGNSFLAVGCIAELSVHCIGVWVP